MIDHLEPITHLTFVDALRQATSESHARLEELPISKTLVSPLLTIKDYNLYLSLMHGVVKSLEDDIFPLIAPNVSDLPKRYKSQLIAADLADIDNLAHFKFEATNTAFAYGIFYVVEGSTLGGRYILQNVSKTLGLSSDSGAVFFAGYGNQSGMMWKTFMKDFQHFAAETGQYDDIILGAKYAFEHIYNHFERACR